MDYCPNAYRETGIEYILCKRAPTPKPYDRKAVFRAACGHQTFCRTANCHRLTEGWRECFARENKTVSVRPEKAAEPLNVELGEEYAPPAPAAPKPHKPRKTVKK